MSTWKAVGFVLTIGIMTAVLIPLLVLFVEPARTRIAATFFAVIVTVVLTKILERLYALDEKLKRLHTLEEHIALLQRGIRPPGGPSESSAAQPRWDE